MLCCGKSKEGPILSQMEYGPGEQDEKQHDKGVQNEKKNDGPLSKH